MPSSLFFPVQSRALEMITQELAQVDRGLSWATTYKETVGSTTVASILISAPVITLYHARFSVCANKGGFWSLHEDPTASGGTSIVSFNRNRTLANDLLLPVTHTPTVTASVGTILENGVIGIGGVPVESIDWGLSPNTLYLLRFSADAADTTVVLRIHYYVGR